MKKAKSKMWRAIAAWIFYASVLPSAFSFAQENPPNVFGLPDCSKASNLLTNIVCIQTTTTGGRTTGHIYTWSLATSTFTDITPGTGTVTSISTTSPITGGPITTTGTIAIDNAAADGATKGAATFAAADFNASAGVISLDYTNGQKATGSVPGFLSSADWTTFNAKQAAGSYITALTGDVTASGPGSVAATIANTAVTLAKIANASANSKLLGSGASGSGAAYAELSLGTNLSMSGTTLNAAGGGGALTLVEKKLITSDSTTVTFSSLDGNTDEVYLLIGRFKNNAVGDSQYTLQPNGISTNQVSGFAFADNGIFTQSNTTTLRVHSLATGTFGTFEVTIHAKANPNSVASTRWFTGTMAALYTTIVQGMLSGRWNETSTNITSIDVVASGANGIGSGSTLALYKYSQS